MFARYFIELPMSPGQVTDALARHPEEWVPGLAAQANHVGDTLLADVGFGDHLRIARTVVLEIGEPVAMAAKTLIPLRWEPTGPRGLFPSMEADLEIGPLSASTTQLAMSARYVPPLGAVGRAMDRTMLSRVAEATLKDFLDRVGHALMSPMEDAPPDTAV